MSELGANFSLGFNARRPVDHDSVSSATIMRSDLLGPLEWRIASPCPSDSIMWERRRVSPIIQMRHVDLSSVEDAVQSHHLIVSAFWSALRARSVVADDVN